MYTATVQITINNNFVPFSKAPSFTTPIGAPTNTSPQGSGGSKVFSGDGQSITITRPAGYTGSVQLTYQLYSPDYILAGIAVNAKVPSGQGAVTSTGRTQFRTVTINRDQSGSQMIVTDALLDNANYSYLLLVQAVATGELGAIDPDIENEGGE